MYYDLNIKKNQHLVSQLKSSCNYVFFSPQDVKGLSRPKDLGDTCYRKPKVKVNVCIVRKVCLCRQNLKERDIRFIECSVGTC